MRRLESEGRDGPSPNSEILCIPSSSNLIPSLSLKGKPLLDVVPSTSKLKIMQVMQVINYVTWSSVVDGYNISKRVI